MNEIASSQSLHYGRLKTRWLCGSALCAFLLAVALGCSALGAEPADQVTQPAPASSVLAALKAKYAPDRHFGFYRVGLQTVGSELLLTGAVDSAQARLDTLGALEQAGLKVKDQLVLLPAKSLGDRVWGIACLSVASARNEPEHKAEMDTQVLMGRVVQVLKPGTNNLWYYMQSADGEAAWLEKGTFARCTQAEANAWNQAPLLIVTALEDCVLAEPRPGSEPVSDVVIADLLKKVGQHHNWYKVELPDGRSGFLPRQSATDYAAWQKQRRPTAENIERTARRFLGRPYLWGGTSPKGFDCSGFTQLVFYLNGIDLGRNARDQVHDGAEIPLDADLNQLRKGDLLLFGRPPRGNRPEHIFHAGIYLGGKLFIQSSERVQISSLDPNSPIRDEHRIRTLLHARRVLTANLR